MYNELLEKAFDSIRDVFEMKINEVQVYLILIFSFHRTNGN